MLKRWCRPELIWTQNRHAFTENVWLSHEGEDPERVAEVAEEERLYREY